MHRLALVAALSVLAAACALTTSWLYPAQRGAPDGGARETEFSAEWRGLSEPERLSLSVRYEIVAERADAARVFRVARQFAALSEDDQARLRALHEVLESTLSVLSPAERGSLRSLHERARAEAIYRLLEARSPDVIADLRKRLNKDS